MKRAALSVRIAETTKKAIDKAAAKDHRSTASLVELILTDHLARMSGLPAKYPNPDEWLAAGRKLLDLPVPNGKLLGDCTGAECQRLSRRYGAFFAEIGKRLNPHDHVRQHLSEAELQAIARQHRLLGPKADR